MPTHGTISYLNYGNNENEIWVIESNCPHVLIESEHFDLENGFDVVFINGEAHTGSTEIHQIVPGNFEVEFISDDRDGTTILY